MKLYKKAQEVARPITLRVILLLLFLIAIAIIILQLTGVMEALLDKIFP